MPPTSTRGLKRSISAAGFEDEEAEDANGRAEEIKKERMAAWSKAQAARRKFATASYINTDKLTRSHLDTWFKKQAVAQQFEGKPGKSHRVFVLSGERWSPETSASPWAEDPPSTASLEMALDWLLERQGPCDTLLVFDGRSPSIRKMIQQKMETARHVSEIWTVYEPKREGAGRKTVFASRNREVG